MDKSMPIAEMIYHATCNYLLLPPQIFCTSTNSSPATPLLPSLPLSEEVPIHAPSPQHINPFLFLPRGNSSPSKDPLLRFDTRGGSCTVPLDVISPLHRACAEGGNRTLRWLMFTRLLSAPCPAPRKRLLIFNAGGTS